MISIAPRPACSILASARPSAISSSIVSTFTPRAESIVMVQPFLFRARRPSAWRRGGNFVFADHLARRVTIGDRRGRYPTHSAPVLGLPVYWAAAVAYYRR